MILWRECPSVAPWPTHQPRGFILLATKAAAKFWGLPAWCTAAAPVLLLQTRSSTQVSCFGPFFLMPVAPTFIFAPHLFAGGLLFFFFLLQPRRAPLRHLTCAPYPSHLCPLPFSPAFRTPRAAARCLDDCRCASEHGCVTGKI